MDEDEFINGEHRGVAYRVGPRTPCPGIGWSIGCWDHLGREIAPIESGGAFYDGADDHPEGAYAWAENSVKKFIDRMLDRVD